MKIRHAFGFVFSRRTIPLHLTNFSWAASRVECLLDSGMARHLLSLIEMSCIYLLQRVCVYVNCLARDVEEAAASDRFRQSPMDP